MTEKERQCEGCLWFHQCPSEKICEYYDPIDEEESEAAAVEEYFNILEENHRIYMDDIIDELYE